jgi:hypothetical protein
VVQLLTWFNVKGIRASEQVLETRTPIKSATFITLSIVLALLCVEQFIAAIMIAPAHSVARQMSPERGYIAGAGMSLYLVGIGVQGIVCVCMATLTILWQYNSLERLRDTPHAHLRLCDSRHLALHLSLGMILMRTCYRLLELSGFLGGDSPLAHIEGLFYGLEVTPMLIALGVWLLVDTDMSLTSKEESYKYHEVGVSSL